MFLKVEEPTLDSKEQARSQDFVSGGAVGGPKCFKCFDRPPTSQNPQETSQKRFVDRGGAGVVKTKNPGVVRG